MKKNNMILGGFLIIIAAIMWGLDGILLTPSYFSKFHFYDVNFIVFIAHAIPTFILSVLFTKQFKMLKTFTKSDYLFFILIAVFGGSIGTLSIVKALQLSEYSKFSIVILIQKSQPIFAVFLAFLILKERPSKKFYIIAGISLISTVFGKKIVGSFSFLTSTFYRFFFTSLVMLVFVLFSGTTEKSLTTLTGNKSLMSLSLFIAIFGLFAILIYYNGLKSVPASTATFCELAYPLTSVIAEAVILKRFLSPVQFISAIILVGSILYLNLSKIDTEF